MKKKILIIFLFILFALPIPVAILGTAVSFTLFMWTLLSEGFSFAEIMAHLFGLIIGTTYLATYSFALITTWKEKKISIKSFLPIAHCLLAFLFLLTLFFNVKTY